MRFLRQLAAFVILTLLATLLPPAEIANAAGAFTLVINQTRNDSLGETTWKDVTSASPGDTISLFLNAYNSGPDSITGGRISVPQHSDWTTVSHSTYWRWNSASNTLNSNKGERLFSPLYLDNDSSDTVTAGDTRVSKYGVNATATGPLYAAGSTVAGGEDDTTIGAALAAVTYPYITGGDATWVGGESVYVKETGNNNLTDVEIGDVRVIAVGSYSAGTEVISGDTDLCTGCLTQAGNIKRLGNTDWPFDEGGFPIGDWGVGVTSMISIRTTSAIINMSSSNLIQNTVTFSGSNVASTTKTSTINVDTAPSVSSITFTPSSITNDGLTNTKVEVVATDKNGAGDITGVTLNLSTIGGSATTVLHDDGTNGDTTASDGTWSLSGITTTTATAATYTALIATATDSTAQTATLNGTLIVQAGGAPTITINSVSDTDQITTDKIIGAAGTVTVNWQSSAPLWQYELRMGSCGGTLLTGTNVALGDGTAEILAAATPVSSTLDNANFSAGANTVYVCGTDVNTFLGQVFTAVTKDLTAPTVTITATNPNLLTTGQTSSVSWNANESGSYAVRVGSCAGTLVTGPNASGNYTSGNLSSTIAVNDISEGTNTIYACLTDAGGNAGSATTTIDKDTTPPGQVTGLTLTDNDTTNDGVNGFDVTLNWTPATADTSFNRYWLYLLPAATTLDTNSHNYIKQIIGSQATNTWTGDATITTDSAGATISADDYIAYVVAQDNVGQKSTPAASAAATLVMDDLAAPTFVSATTTDVNTVRLNFSENISFVDPTKITATGLTIDGTYNLDGYTNGIKISGADAKQVFLRLNPALATNYTAADLAFSACAVRDVTGNSDLNEAGNCTDLVPATNTLAAISGQAIADGTGPALTLTAPAASSTDNATLAVDYTLSEAATTGTLFLKFTATGGTGDLASPHTISLTDTLVGGTATTAGNHTFTLDASNFTSIQNGAADALVSGTIYTVSLDAKDASPAQNSGATASNTNFTYDSTPPSAPIATQAFSSPTANPTPAFDWGTVADAVSYDIELSLQATNYVPAFVAQNITAPTTTWTLDPAFATDGTNDDTYIWRVYATDAAGNTSVASNQLTFVLNTITDTPSIVLKDQTSASQTATNSQTVDVTLDGYSTNATHYLLSETQNTQPAAGAITTALPGGAPQTVPFTFTTATEETKTVYIWVKDGLGNVSANVSSDSIMLDTTGPDQPTLSTSDTNNGAQAGKTNAATVSIAVGNDTGVAKWCVASGASGWTPTTPTESLCTTGQTGGTSASGWLSSRPTTFTLAGTGVKDLYVWTQDSAGNLSIASAIATIDYQTTVPPDPALALADQTSGSSNFTDATLINVTVTNDATGWKWIVSQTDASKPSETSLAWTTEPTTLNLTTGDGSKTVYVWVKNAYGNISANQISAGITLDTTPATLSTAKTQDLSGNGQIDALQITMNENINDTTLVSSNFTLSDGYAVNNLTGTLGTLSFVNGIATGVSSDDQIFYLAVTESGSTDTGIKPNLTYAAGALADRAGNLTASFGPTATTDGVKPVMTAIELYDTGGASANGKADQIKVIYSEALAATTATAPWALNNTPSGGTLNSVALGTTNVANDTIVLTLTEGNDSPDTTSGTFTLTLDNASSAVKDTANNTAANFTPTAATDKMAPILVAANYLSTGAVANDSLILSFSESLLDASSFQGTPATDLTIVGTGAVGNANYNTVTANDNSFTVELNAGDTAFVINTDTIALKSAKVADANGNASTSTGAVTILGGIIINEIAWAGSATGATDEYIELRNLSGAAIDFGVNTHCLYVGATKLADLTGTLAGNSYYLVNRYTELDVNSALNIAPDLVPGAWQTLPDTGLQLRLYSSIDATCNNADTLLDQTDDGAGAPFAGTVGPPPASMERNASVGLGTTAGSWHTAVTSTNFDDTNQKGTPGAANVSDATAPSFTASSEYPAHQTLLPAAPDTLTVTYSDNAGGVGVDTASVTLEVDLNGDGDYLDASEGIAGDCSGGALTTLTTTQVTCTLPSTLTAGRHSVRATVADLAGNSAQTTWDFWVDDLTISITNVDQADLGITIPGSPVSTNDNAKHTKITITTYGAGVSVTGTPNGQLTYGATTIPWHTNNTATAGLGSAWRVKEGAAGIFSNYYNWGANQTVFTKNKFTGAQLASTNALQTYTFYVQHYASIDSLQAAGQYNETVTFLPSFSY
jgi:hypothetical protein